MITFSFEIHSTVMDSSLTILRKSLIDCEVIRVDMLGQETPTNLLIFVTSFYVSQK